MKALSEQPLPFEDIFGDPNAWVGLSGPGNADLWKDLKATFAHI